MVYNAGMKVLSRAQLRAKEKLARRIVERSEVVDEFLRSALEHNLSEEDFRTRAREVLTEYYGRKSLFRKPVEKTDEELDREIDSLLASYDNRRNVYGVDEDEKEINRNKMSSLEQEMDIILRLYEPMMKSSIDATSDFVDKLEEAFNDPEKVSISIYDDILIYGDKANDAIGRVAYLISNDFKNIVGFERLNDEYRSLVGRDYAVSPLARYDFFLEQIYEHIGAKLQALKIALNEKKDALREQGLADVDMEKCDKILKGLLIKAENGLRREGKPIDFASLNAEAMDIVNHMEFQARVHRTEDRDEPTEEPVDTREKKSLKERIKDKFPFFTKRKKKDHYPTDEELEQQVTEYKNKVEAYNTKVALLNARELEVKTKGAIAGTTVREIYESMSTLATLSSLVSQIVKEDELKKLKLELDILEIDIATLKLDYLNTTGRSINTHEGIGTITLDRQLPVVSGSLDEFIAKNDKYIAIAEKRIAILNIELPTATDAHKAEINNEIDKLQKYILAEQSLITRGIVSACQQDRTLNIDTILSDRVTKLATIRTNVEAELAYLTRPIPTPLDEDRVKAEAARIGLDPARLDALKVKVPNIYETIDNDLKSVLSLIKTNLPHINKIGVQDLMYGETTYKIMLDPLLQTKANFLIIHGLDSETCKEILADYNNTCYRKNQAEFVPIVSRYVSGKLTGLTALGFDINKAFPGKKIREMVDFASRYNAQKTLFERNFNALKVEVPEDSLYTYKGVLFDKDLITKIDIIKTAGEKVEDYLDKLPLSLEDFGKLFDTGKSFHDELTDEQLENMGFDLMRLGLLFLEPANVDKFRVIPKDVLERNIAIINYYGIQDLAYNAEELIIFDDEQLEEKAKYLINEGFLDEDIARLFSHYKNLLATPDYKDRVEGYVLGRIEFLKSNGFDISKIPGLKLGEIYNYYNKISSKTTIIQNNVLVIKMIKVEHKLYQEPCLTLILDPDLMSKVEALLNAGITHEDIGKLWLEKLKLSMADLQVEIDKLKPKEPTKEEKIAALKEKLRNIGVNSSLLDAMGITDIYDKLLTVDFATIERNFLELKNIRMESLIYQSDSYLILTDPSLKLKIGFLSDSGLKYEEYLDRYNLVGIKEDFSIFKARIEASILNSEYIRELRKAKYELTSVKGITLGEIKEFYKSVSVASFIANVKLLTEYKLDVYEKRVFKLLQDKDLGKKVQLLKTYGITKEVIKSEWLFKLDTITVTELHKELEEKNAIHLKGKPEEHHITLSRLNFRDGPQPINKEGATIVAAVPMLKVEVYKNGVRVELLKQAKDQLKDLQVKVALVGRNKDGKLSSRAKPNTTHTLKEGESVDLTSADFDLNQDGLKITSTYQTEEEINAKNEVTVSFRR